MSRKKKLNTNHSAEFKTTVIMDMSENPLGHCGTVDKFIRRRLRKIHFQIGQNDFSSWRDTPPETRREPRYQTRFGRSADELIKIIFQVAELDTDSGLSQRVDISQAPIRNLPLQRMVAHVSPNRPLHSEYVFSQFIYSRTLANKADSPGEMSSSLVFSTLKWTVKLSFSLTNCVQIPFGYPINTEML